MDLDFELAETIRKTGRKVVFCTDNDETLGYCSTFHDVSSWELTEMILFRDVVYDDEDEFVDAYVDYFWEEDSGLSEAGQIEELKLAAERKWNLYCEEVILVRTDWWSPREA